jgi:hypothetical protein
MVSLIDVMFAMVTLGEPCRNAFNASRDGGVDRHRGPSIFLLVPGKRAPITPWRQIGAEMVVPAREVSPGSWSTGRWRLTV